MSAHSAGLVRGVIVTLKGNESNGCVDNSGAVYDFVSRYFAPWVGIPEDPVTGSELELQAAHAIFFSPVCFSIVIRKATLSRTCQMPPPSEM